MWLPGSPFLFFHQKIKEEGTDSRDFIWLFCTASNPVGLLRDEFAVGDIESRVRASSRLKLLATVLGPEKTCSELLPAVTGTSSSILSDIGEWDYLD